MLDYGQIYHQSVDFALDLLCPKMPDYPAFQKFCSQHQEYVPNKTYNAYLVHMLNLKISEKKNMAANLKLDFLASDNWKILSFLRQGKNLFITDSMAMKLYAQMTVEQKNNLKDFVVNSAQTELLELIFQINSLAQLCADLYHAMRINYEFNFLENFAQSEFIVERDKGNCTKGLTLNLCKSLHQFGCLQNLPQEKEVWAHPMELFYLVQNILSQKNETLQSSSLELFMQNRAITKGTFLVVNGHHTMVYSGKNDCDGKPLCHGFSPELVFYPLKLDKKVFIIDIPSMVKKICPEHQCEIITTFLNATEQDIKDGNILQKFSERFWHM